LTVIRGVVAPGADSLVAVIVAVPWAAAVTVVVPFVELAGLTVSTAVLLEAHVTDRPVSTLPFASLAIAVSSWVPPTAIGVVGAETVTELTGASVTVIEDIPVFVSLVAVIVVLPAATAVTRPFPSTVAADVLLEVHVTTRPVTTLLTASRSVAVSCCVGVIPTTRLAEDGVTVTVLTGASVTVIEDVPVCVSLVAVIVTGPPAATAVTRPFASTVAAAVLLEVHVTTRPVSTLLAASRSVAVSCCVGAIPSARLAEDGVTVTVATGASITVIEDVPVFVSLVAVMVTGPPAATAVTRPFASTVAVAVLLELHVITRPVSTLPFKSLVTAVSCCVGVTPTTRLADDGVTVTVLTGASVTVIADVLVLVSLVAVIVVLPAPTAVTRPFTSTVAAAVLLEVHVTTRPVSTLLAASRSVAVSCCVGVIPSTRLAEVGATVTVATGTGLTVITGVVAPGADSLVAVIVAVPSPTAVTVTLAPLEVLTVLAALTERTDGLLETQLTTRPDRLLLLMSFGKAVSACVPPTIIAVPGTDRVTVATGAGLTVSVALPVFPSLIAMICTEPGLFAVTTPVGETVATAALPELHVTLRPARGLPVESRVVAVACVVCPTVINVEASDTVTSATGTGTTVIEEVPVFPSLVAVTVAPPIASEVTRPLADTLAIDGASDDHVTVRPLRTLLLASLVSAASWRLVPMTTLADWGLTITRATLGITVSAAVPAWPPLVARICAEPAPMAVTRPPTETVATALLSEVQVMVRPVSTLPPASSTVAVACVVCASVIMLGASVTLTDATGIGETVIDEVPLTPSLVAVSVAVPAEFAVTSPLDETLATASLLDDQVTARASTLLWASFKMTLTCSVPPCTTVALVGTTVTEATGDCVTVRVALPLLPSHVAVMLAVPTASAVTTPWAEIVATAVFPEVHVTTRPVNTPPFTSSVVAAACDEPTAVIEFGESATVTDATGTGITVIEDVPAFPSLVAVIMAAPTETAVTSPVLFTLATAALLDDQVTKRSVTTTLFASLVSADSCCVAPAITVAEVGLTVTEPTGTGITVTLALPDFPSLVALIVVEPTPTPVTTPDDDTVATAELPLFQAITRPVRMLLLASNVVAVAWVVWPTWIVVADRNTLTEATGIGVTVIEDVPLFPSLVAVMTAVPLPTAVTRPLDVTLANVGSLDDQFTTRPVRTLPLASLVVAINWCVNPTVSVADEGLTITDATGTVTVIEAVPVLVSLVAVIVALPPPAAVTKPLASTVATDGLLEVQATTRPVRTLLFASLSVAVSCCVGVIPSARLAEGGVTVTVATGIGLTVITGVEPLGADSLLAVIIAVPTPAAVTVIVAPLEVLTELGELTESTAGLLDTQFTVRPTNVLPAASFGIAVSCWIWPRTTGVVGADSVSELTGTGTTVRGALPLFPSLVAAMLALPAAIEVTKPVPDTVATPVLSEDQTMARPANTLLFASRVVAVAWVVWPNWIGDAARDTLTEATGIGVTVSVALPVCPPLAPVMWALPAASAVTTPLLDTVAMAVLSEVQATMRPVSTLLAASRNVALAWAFCPIFMVPGESATLTLATGTWDTVIEEVPACPSLVAVIVVVPMVPEAAVTRPLVDTVATAVLLDDQLTGRVSTLWCASSNSTVSCSLAPWNTVALGGLTITVATGAWVTVTGALPAFPSLVPTMFAVPTATALTTPCAETVATNVLLELHVTARPVNTPPLASSVVAAAWDVPTAVIEFGVRDTVTDATGTGITVIEEDPVFPSLVALIVAEPSAWVVTSPFRSTVAIVLSVEDHVTCRPVSVVPLASFVAAVSCWVELRMTFALAGLTLTVATGTGVTVRVAWPVFVSLVAMICALPAETDVTNPPDETVAMLVLLDVHVIDRPDNWVPLASKVVAVAWVVWPATTEPNANDTVTDETGIGVTVTLAVAILPSLTAMMVATPGEPAETSPIEETVATFGAFVFQSIARPVRTLWWASSSVAVSCCVANWTTVILGGLRVTVATGAGVIVIVALPLFPSLVAVMLAVPTATAVTTPSAETVATAGLRELHVTARPLSVAPLASSVVAAAWPVPTAVMEFGVRLTFTEATGTTVTVIEVVAVFPSLVAVMVAVPTDTAVTRPVVLTVAAPVLLELHVTARPVSALPLASLVSAASCWVAPVTMLADKGVMVTDATGTAETVIVALPLFPSLVAVICAVPGASAVTAPLGETVATADLSELHVTERPLSAWPAASVIAALAWLVWPTCAAWGVSVTATAATGTGVTVTVMLEVTPPADARTIAVPGLIAVTNPPAVTEAIAMSEVAQVMARFNSVPPCESVGVAVSCTVSPTTRGGLPGGERIVTAATGSGVRIA
jgi:hypothetical protein